ncbi:putative metalloprotease CJM1_0395 family protein [Methylocucumis oryzae]|uniref:putative metalloprotease CJM1_0395 family protein n=1 Tax=Methylocucumis oryzae TaxID=1632867 RepID=UPI000698EE47|nr:putative metalloprotease CJM1_0395 family protein [Methylocucumis oryzae]
MAHLAAAAGVARSGASFTYQLGPDGVSYAIGGEVNIDTSEVAGNPEATLRKAQIIKSAALAPAEPSNQDFQVAAAATAMAIKAISEIAANAKGEIQTKGAFIDVSA